jgi:hydrogenase maturation protease
VILVDAVARGEPPGTLFLIEPESPTAEKAGTAQAFHLESHALDPARVLSTATALGSQVRRVLVVGCEPMPLDPDLEGSMELSAPVQAAVSEAASLIESLVTGIRAGPFETPTPAGRTD